MKIGPGIEAGLRQLMAASVVVFLSGMLLVTISLTTFDPRWTVFLGGVLAAAILAFLSRTVSARWTIKRKAGQLNVARMKLAAETGRRVHAEEALKRLATAVELVDEALPAMLAYVDGEQRLRYHNRSFKRFVGAESSAIEGRRLEELVGPAAYRDIEQSMLDAMNGRDVRFEWMRRAAAAQSCRLEVHCLPHHGADGQVCGVFVIMNDVTVASDLQADPRAEALDMGARLTAALEHDQFSLHCQDIAPLQERAGVPHYEVLLRMNEEEEQQIPPGSFLPLAEQLGLLPEIDRWVVRHVIDSAARSDPAVYMMNLSVSTLRDAAFPAFVLDCLRSKGVAGSSIGFELMESDVLANRDAVRDFIDGLGDCGCRIAVSGFGSSPLALRLLRQMRFDLLKIDAGLVLAVGRDPAELAKLNTLNRAAQAVGMQTIAECVEDETTRTLLASIGIDFAQGFGIAKPRPMAATGAGGRIAAAA